MTRHVIGRTVQQCPACEAWQIDYSATEWGVLADVEEAIHKHLTTECPGTLLGTNAPLRAALRDLGVGVRRDISP